MHKFASFHSFFICVLTLNVHVAMEGVNIIALTLLGHTAAAAGVGIFAVQGDLVSLLLFFFYFRGVIIS